MNDNVNYGYFNNLSNEEGLFIKIFLPLSKLTFINVYKLELLAMYFKKNFTYLGLLTKPRKMKGALRKLINKDLILKLPFRDEWILTEYGEYFLKEYKIYLEIMNEINESIY
jgi:hypothetical protein